MMSIRSLADFNGSSLGGDSDWLTPTPSPPRPHKPGRHGEQEAGTFTWPPARTSTWPLARTFSWPRTRGRPHRHPTFQAVYRFGLCPAPFLSWVISDGLVTSCPWLGFLLPDGLYGRGVTVEL